MNIAHLKEKSEYLPHRLRRRIFTKLVKAYGAVPEVLLVQAKYEVLPAVRKKWWRNYCIFYQIERGKFVSAPGVSVIQAVVHVGGGSVYWIGHRLSTSIFEYFNVYQKLT